MVEPGPQRFSQAEHARHHAAGQHVHVHRNARFQLGEPEQRFHHQIGVDIAGAGLDDDTDVLGRLVAQIRDQRQLPLVEQFGDLLDQPALLDAVRDLGDDCEPSAPALILDMPARPGAESTAAGAIGLDHRRTRLDDDAAGREIGARHEGHQLFGGRVRMLDQIERGVTELGGVVRRDRGRHADRDALRAIGEQVREGGGEHHRLLVLTVIGLAEIDRVLLDPVEQEARDLGHARFGVTVGGGVIAVDIAEIALAVDERVALGEVLRQAHQRIIDRLVAMRVELTDDVADDAGAFLMDLAGVEPEQAHGVQDAAVDRLQPVARIRQGAVHDRRQRIGEVALLERALQIDAFGFLRRRRLDGFAHAFTNLVRHAAS